MLAHYTDEHVRLYHGDCIEVMRQLPDASVDAVVTDPPYGLEFMGKEWDSFAQGGGVGWKAGQLTDIQGLPDGNVFKEKGFDKLPAFRGMTDDQRNTFQSWCTEWATEALRVLKPGGHLLAFGGTRTWHRLACAIEDAGFEVRDSIAWMYGSGFPKSLDVSKAMDKRRDEDLQPAADVARWLVDQLEARGLARKDVSEHFGAANIAQQWTTHWTDGAVKPRVPRWEQWLELKSWLTLPDDMDAEVWRLNGRKGKPGDNFDAREVLSEQTVEVKGGTWAEQINSGRYRIGERTIAVTAPATPLARKWQGWGTALKPAFEPVVVARKPLVGTVAANVERYGTGALNIDGCRIGFASDADEAESKGKNRHADFGTESGGNEVYGDYSMVPRVNYNPPGRWPANVILDGYKEPVLRLRDNLPVEVERTIREAFGAGTDHLPAVRDDSEHPAEQSHAPEVLLAQVPSVLDVGEPRRGEGSEVGQGSHAGDAGKDRSDETSQPQDGRESRELEGREVPQSRIRLREADIATRGGAGEVRVDGDRSQGRSGHHDALHSGASVGNGSGPRPPADERGARSPHQRSEVGQPSRESGSDKQLSAPPEALGHRSGDVPTAGRERSATGSPLEVLRRECPPQWWDYFYVVRQCESQAEALDRQSGVSTSQGGKHSGRVGTRGEVGSYGFDRQEIDRPTDAGGASRFFYTAKADSYERPRVDGVAHPTVKPLDLMRYLVRLVTPPGGVVLEPFAGSGTTLEACIVEGFRCIGIEREADYIPLIMARISKPIEPVMF